MKRRINGSTGSIHHPFQPPSSSDSLPSTSTSASLLLRVQAQGSGMDVRLRTLQLLPPRFMRQNAPSNQSPRRPIQPHPHPTSNPSLPTGCLPMRCLWQARQRLLLRRCASCNLDLHITCASMPLTRTHPSHHHLHNLTFSPPYPNRSFSCDICGNLGSNQWPYRCHSCEFDAHLSCAMKKPVAPVSSPLQQPLMQSYSTLPAQYPQAQIFQPPTQFPQAGPYYPDLTHTTQRYQTDPMASATTHFQGVACIFQSPTPANPCISGAGQPVGM